MPGEPGRTHVERIVERDLDRRQGAFSHRTLQTPRTVEGYIAASSPPRWMERLAEVDLGIARERRRLGEARAALAADPSTFAARWDALVEGWRYDEELNDLIRLHNEWYPVERRLPVDPRTGDYVLIHGRSYRRPLLGPDWARTQFPAG